MNKIVTCITLVTYTFPVPFLSSSGPSCSSLLSSSLPAPPGHLLVPPRTSDRVVRHPISYFPSNQTRSPHYIYIHTTPSSDLLSKLSVCPSVSDLCDWAVSSFEDGTVRERQLRRCATKLSLCTRSMITRQAKLRVMVDVFQAFKLLGIYGACGIWMSLSDVRAFGLTCACGAASTSAVC